MASRGTKRQGSPTKVSAKVSRTDNDTTDCAICQQPLVNPITINPCNHRFCLMCLGIWLGYFFNIQCPDCQAAITQVSLRFNVRSNGQLRPAEIVLNGQDEQQPVSLRLPNGHTIAIPLTPGPEEQEPDAGAEQQGFILGGYLGLLLTNNYIRTVVDRMTPAQRQLFEVIENQSTISIGDGDVNLQMLVESLGQTVAVVLVLYQAMRHQQEHRVLMFEVLFGIFDRGIRVKRAIERGPQIRH